MSSVTLAAPICRPTYVQCTEDTSGLVWCTEFEAGLTAPVRTWVERRAPLYSENQHLAGSAEHFTEPVYVPTPVR